MYVFQHISLFLDSVAQGHGLKMDLFYCLLICVRGHMPVFSHRMVASTCCSDPQSELLKGRGWFHMFLSFQDLVWGLTPLGWGA